MSDLTIGDQIKGAIREWSDNRPRSLQSQRGALGISDVGGCREYARLVTTNTAPSDERKTWAADVGTAVDHIVKQAVDQKYGNEVATDHRVVCTYPGGAQLPGTPDIVFPQVVVDIKTKNGLATIRKSGPTNQNWYQVNAYAKGLLDDETFDGGKDVTCVLVFLDRSGADDEPAVFTKDYNPLILNEAADWIADVTYAVEHGEPASKDWPINKCESYCEYFTSCRGEDASPSGGLIDHPEILAAIDQYNEGRQMAKAGKALQDEAKFELVGVDGSTGENTVRWVQVSGSEIPAMTRSGYSKIEVKPVKKGK